MNYLRKYLSVFCLFGISHTAQAEDGARVTFFDVGDTSCVLAKTPDTAIIFTDDLDQGGPCFKKLSEMADALNGAILVNLTGQPNDSTVWQNTFSLKNEITEASLISSVDGEDLAILGDTRLLSIQLSKIHSNGSGFMSKLTFAHLHLIFLSEDASDGARDPNHDCGQSGQQYDPDTAYDLDADLILVPNTGSAARLSNCFLTTVSPHVAVFTAGHGNQLPTTQVAERYFKLGLKEHNMLRTDRGDNEGGMEWQNSLSVAGCVDAKGDDRITATLSKNGTLRVGYDQPQQACEGVSGG